MSGQEVLDYLNVVALKPTNSGAFAHFSGVEMTITDEGVKKVSIGGAPLDLDKTYKMATLSFSASGGGNYPDINTLASYIDTGFVDADVLREYIEQNSPLQVEAFKPEGVTRL